RGGLAPRREWLCGPTRQLALLPVPFAIAIEATDKLAEPVRNALVHYFVVHGPQLLPEAGLHISTQFRRFRVELFAPSRRSFHRILLSQGLSFVHCLTPNSEALGRAPVAPSVCVKTRDLAYGSLRKELFCDAGVGALQADGSAAA